MGDETKFINFDGTIETRKRPSPIDTTHVQTDVKITRNGVIKYYTVSYVGNKWDVVETDENGDKLSPTPSASADGGNRKRKGGNKTKKSRSNKRKTFRLHH
jgi:hypothetical protein